MVKMGGRYQAEGAEPANKGLRSFFKGEKGTKWLFIIGLAGIILIFASSFFSKKEEAAPLPKQDILTADQYAEKLERKLEEIIGSISGVGNPKVMVTLENGIEYIYAQEEKNSGSKTEDVTSNGSKIQHSSDRENNYLIVDGASGKQALIVTEVQPTIKGVVVVCSGGGQPAVQQRIITAVSTALNVTSARVCVVEASQNGR